MLHSEVIQGGIPEEILVSNLGKTYKYIPGEVPNATPYKINVGISEKKISEAIRDKILDTHKVELKNTGRNLEKKKS